MVRNQDTGPGADGEESDPPGPHAGESDPSISHGEESSPTDSHSTPGFEDPAHVLDTVDDGVYTLDTDFVITSVNRAVATMTGYDPEELVGSHASLLAGDDTLSMADEMLQVLRGDGEEVGRIDTSIRSADGEPVPIETRFSTIELADGTTRYLGVVRDVADRRRYEAMLAALTHSARQLLRAEDDAAIHECVVGTIVSVVADASIVAYRYEDGDTALRPVASHGAEPTVREPGSDEWQAFAVGGAPDAGDADGDDPSRTTFRASVTGDGELAASFDPLDDDLDRPSGRVLERRRDGGSGGPPESRTDDASADSGGPNRRLVYVTLDEYGLLVIETPADEWYEDAPGFVELLAANAVAALGRVERESELASRRETLAEREARLTRLHEFNDLLRRVNDALVDAETVEGVATDVCDLLATAGPVALAWIAEPGRDGALRPLARAGRADEYLAALPNVDGAADADATRWRIDPADLDGEPTALAAVEGEPVVVSAVSDGLRTEAWRERALAHGFQSVVSVPLEYDGVGYGVLSVYGDDAGAFDGAFGEMLAELGATAANAIDGIETRRSLRRESTTELDLRIADDDASLPRLAGVLGTTLRLDGVVPDGDGCSLLYVTADADPTPLADALPAVEHVRTLGETADERSAEVLLGRETTTVVERLAGLGATIEAATVDADHVDVTIGLPRGRSARSVVEALSTDARSIDLRARRGRDGPPRTPGEFRGALEERLTDRQLQAIRTAYLSGYFDWPRASTGEEVADALGITQPTFNRHFRTAQRKLFDALFDADGGDRRD